jgi:hypothetical protein
MTEVQKLEGISESQAPISENVAKPEGNATAWCTVAGGCVGTLHNIMSPLMVPVKVVGTFRNLWIHIIIRSIPGFVCLVWDIVFFQRQLDWISASLVFHGHVASRRKPP